MLAVNRLLEIEYKSRSFYLFYNLNGLFFAFPCSRMKLCHGASLTKLFDAAQTGSENLADLLQEDCRVLEAITSPESAEMP